MSNIEIINILRNARDEAIRKTAEETVAKIATMLTNGTSNAVIAEVYMSFKSRLESIKSSYTIAVATLEREEV